jgi:hypothetical protein
MGVAMGNNPLNQGGNPGPFGNNPLNQGGNPGAFGNAGQQLGQQPSGFGGGFASFGGGQFNGQFGQLGGQFGFQGVNYGAYLPRIPRPNQRTLYGDRLTYADYINRLRGKPTAADANSEKPPVQTVRDPLDKQAGALAVADGTLGDMFEYTIEEPITLAKQRSALVPLVNEPVEGSRVSIFNASTLEKHPLLGLKLVNKTKLHLAQGPVAVFDGGTFAGDARLPDLKPNETRLVSYAIDLGTEVVVSTHDSKSTLLAVAVAGDRVTFRSTLRRTTTYLIRNRNPQDRTVVLEHPLSDEWKLIAPAKPSDRTRSYYRFDVPVKSGALARYEVTEESTGTESVALASLREELPGSEVVVRPEPPKATLASVTVADGHLYLRSTLRRTTTYQIRNRTMQDRTVAVEHPLTLAWKLVAPEKPDEQTRTFYRFDVPLKAGAVAGPDVVEESVGTDTWRLTDLTRENLLHFISLKEAKPAVRDVLKKLLELREKIDENNRAIDEQLEALKEIRDDQERIRANIERTPKESDAFKRYLKKFDDQEAEIEKRRARMKELKADLVRTEKALKEVAAGAKAE